VNHDLAAVAEDKGTTSVAGQIIVPYPKSSWTRTNIAGRLELIDNGIRLSARGPMKRFFQPVTLRRDELTRVERSGLTWLRHFGRGFTFRCTRLEADGITFFAYGSRAASLERLVASFVGEKIES
jgi:hypothetical protein